MKNSNLIIVKVGTNTLIKHSVGYIGVLDIESFERIGNQIKQLSSDGYKIILVSSGAISAGALIDNHVRSEDTSLVELQRFAARGWDLIVQKWKGAIGNERISSALLTKREIHDSTMRVKLLDVIQCCLEHDDVFLVNENDVLSDDEIKFGDNDRLAAELTVVLASSNVFKAVCLVLLTDKNGLNKVADDESTLIRKVVSIDAIEHYAGDATGSHSRGGMRSKIHAARLATSAGVGTYIANGRKDFVIKSALEQKEGTYFKPQL